MNPDPLENPLPLAFPVRYEAGSAYNRDLAGAGSLTVRPGEFVFRGRERRSLRDGPEVELVLRPDEIRNVVQRGAGVELVTPIGKSGEKKAPFLFYCENAAKAAQVVALLPAEKDAGFHEAQEFRRRMAQLSAAGQGGVSVTNLLIGANVVVYVIMGFLGAGWFETASMRPYILYVANNGAATTGGEWWRLVTSMFAHYGLLHLACNMWALFQVGHLVEKLFGRTLYTLLYFGSGIIGSLTTLLWHGDKIWSAGASGAVFGVCGALLGYLWHEKHGMPRSVLQPLLKSTGTFAVYNLLYGAVVPNVDNMAHIGGLVSGVMLGWICALPLDPDLRARQVFRRLRVGAAVLTVAITAGVAAAPRYDYRLQDELRFDEALNQHAQDEKSLLAASQKAFAAVRTTNRGAELEAWLGRAIPFYENWRKELLALPLAQSPRTAKRRDALARIFALEIENYRRLQRAIETNDPAEARKYSEQEKVIDQAHLEWERMPRTGH